MTKPKTNPEKNIETKPASFESVPRTEEASIEVNEVTNPQGTPVTSDEEKCISEVLEELDFIKLKEKRAEPAEGSQIQPPVSIQSQIPKPKLTAMGDKLLGILGHCSLKGHIAHFYNLRFEIERHIKNIGEFEDPRFVEAYKYLKANPSIEAIFVYESKMVVANRINGRLVQKTVIS